MSDIRICFVGDSFVNGTGDPTYLGWTGRVCASAAQLVTHYNLGIRGNTSQQIGDRWRIETSLRFPADCDARVVFSFGANDARLEAGAILVEQETSVACARRILEGAKAQYPTLMVGAPPVEASVEDGAMNLRIKALSRAYAEMCAEIEVPYLEVFAPLSKRLVWMREVALIDGSHPQAAGYREFADIVSAWSAWQGWFNA